MTCKIVQGYVITSVELGKGCFGTVYRGYVKDNKSELLAVKTIPLDSIKNEEVVRRQIQILLKLKSPNIVRFYKPAKTAKHLYFFLEYCQQDLKSYVKEKGGKLSEVEVKNILTQICKGFEVVHENNIIHRDIKPANFLIHNGVIKISDFGFARAVDNLEQPLYLTFLGSPLYMAPQILGKQKFSSKCDIWSLGVTIYEILYGRTPFTAQNPKELLDNIRNKPLTFPQNIKRSEQIKDLLRRMLTIDEEKRISWTELFNHEYICPPQLPKELTESEDSLVRSFASNNAHMSRNKVVAKTSISPAMSQIGERPRTQKGEQKQKQQDFNKQLREQEQQIGRYLKLEEVDEIVRYRRNVSVFLNVQCNAFFTYASPILPEPQFHVGLFLLLNHQISLHLQLKQDLQSQKPAFKLPIEIWTSYLKSPAYTRISRLIDCDLKHLSTYFDEVRGRVESHLKNHANRAKIGEKILSSFEKYVQSAKEGKNNEESYESTMRQIIKQLRKTEKKVSDKLFSFKLLITVRPFKYLHPKLDFGLFYEFQNEQIDKLKQQFPELAQ